MPISPSIARTGMKFCILQVPPKNLPHCLWLYSYVNCQGLCPTQHSDATKPKCSAPSRRAALLFQHFSTDLASSRGRHTGFSETDGLPALHSSCSCQPLSIICFPFQPSTSCSFNVSGGLKSICWLPDLCCWKQSSFCYLFQGAGQKPTARESIKPRGGVLRG